MVSASTWTCTPFLGPKMVRACQPHVIRLIYFKLLITFQRFVVWFSHHYSHTSSTSSPLFPTRFQPFWKIGSNQLLERNHGDSERSTYPGLYSHHHRVHLPTRVQRRNPDLWNCQRSICVDYWADRVDWVVSLSPPRPSASLPSWLSPVIMLSHYPHSSKLLMSSHVLILHRRPLTIPHSRHL
jgi:hypothetical protein